MKKLLLILVFVSACSKNSSSPILPSSVESAVDMSLAAEKVDVRQIDNELSLIIEGSSSIDFGSIEAGKTATKDIVFSSPASNPSSVNLDLSSFDSLSSPFSKVSSGCGTTLLKRRSCKVTIKLSPAANATAGNIEISPLVSGLPLQIKANIIPLTPPVVVPGEGLVISPLESEMGNFIASPLSKNISITNSGTGPKALVFSFPESSEFIASHACSPAEAPSLLRNRTCQVQIKFSSLEKPQVDTLKEYTFSVNGKSVKVSAIIKVWTPVEVPSFVFKSSSLDFGSISSPMVKRIMVENTGTAHLVNLSITPPPGASVEATTCLPTLLRQRSCSIDLKLDPSTVAAGPYNQILKIFNPETKAQVSVAATIGSSAPVACIPQDVNNALTVIGNKPNCQATQCINSNYEIQTGMCVAKACVPADIENAALVSGNKVNGCILENCKSGYQKSGNSCQAVASNPLLKVIDFADYVATKPASETKSLMTVENNLLTYSASTGSTGFASYRFMMPAPSTATKHYRVEVEYASQVNCSQLNARVSQSTVIVSSTNVASSGTHTFSVFGHNDTYYQNYISFSPLCMDEGKGPIQSISISKIKVTEVERPVIDLTPGLIYSRNFIDFQNSMDGETFSNVSFSGQGLRYENVSSGGGDPMDPMCMMEPWMPHCMGGGTGMPGTGISTPGTYQIEIPTPLAYFGDGTHRVEITYTGRNNVQMNVSVDNQGGDIVEETANSLIMRFGGIYYGANQIRIDLNGGDMGSNSVDGSINITEIKIYYEE